MLKKYKIAMISLVAFLISGSALSQSFVPSQEQINQFKNMPRAQQEALARQLGIDISALDSNVNDFGAAANIPADAQVDTIVRAIDEEAISETLSEQSAVKKQTAKLRPFGYDLFGTTDGQGSSVSFAPAANTPVPSDYIMGPGDSIKLQLYGKKTGEHELFVNNEGSIQIPELGPMSVTGLSYQELKKELVNKYSQQVIGVTPHITMGTLRTIQVYIVGEAFRPGVFTLSSLSTVTHALFASGGVNDIGSLRNIELKREGQTIVTYDLYDLLIFGDTSKDIRLRQGDVIFIPTVSMLVSVDGQVRRPAIYEIKPNESLRGLLNIAGGLLPGAAGDILQVARNTSERGLEIQTVDTTKSTLNFPLANGDYVNVPESNNEFSNVVLIAGAYANPGLIQWKKSLTLSQLITPSNLLNTTDQDYGLLIRKSKFASKSQIIQFKPKEVLNAEYDISILGFDKIILFNRFDPSLNSERPENNEENDEQQARRQSYLQHTENSAFTESQLLLNDTKHYSRAELLQPIIDRLVNESSQSHPARLVEATGDVKYPGVYPLPDNGSIRDLLIAAGGLVESAYLHTAQLSRFKINTDRVAEIEHLEVDLVNELSKKETDTLLRSKDILNVLRTPEWHDSQTIELVGEVVFPGIYQIKKNETLSDIIRRAGGLTSEATPRAAIFTRQELVEREKANLEKTIEELRQHIISSNVSGSQNVRQIDYDQAQSILSDLLSVEPIGRLVIDLPSLLSNSTVDITLKDGDRLYIPSISSSVSIVGEVFLPATHVLNSGLSVQDYIEQSGGTTQRANQSKIYIVKADGSVKIPSTRFWFSNEELVLEAGDTIVVPRDVVNYERIGLWQTLTQIVYNSAIAIVAIGSI